MGSFHETEGLMIVGLVIGSGFGRAIADVAVADGHCSCCGKGSCLW